MFKRIIMAGMLGCLLCGAAMAEDGLATDFITPPVYWSSVLSGRRNALRARSSRPKQATKTQT